MVSSLVVHATLRKRGPLYSNFFSSFLLLPVNQILVCFNFDSLTHRSLVTIQEKNTFIAKRQPASAFWRKIITQFLEHCFLVLSGVSSSSLVSLHRHSFLLLFRAVLFFRIFVDAYALFVLFQLSSLHCVFWCLFR